MAATAPGARARLRAAPRFREEKSERNASATSDFSVAQRFLKNRDKPLYRGLSRRLPLPNKDHIPASVNAAHPSPEQLAALGLELLDLLAQLLLARLSHLRSDLQKNALDLLEFQENRTSRSLVHLIPPSVSSTQT